MKKMQHNNFRSLIPRLYGIHRAIIDDSLFQVRSEHEGYGPNDSVVDYGISRLRVLRFRGCRDQHANWMRRLRKICIWRHQQVRIASKLLLDSRGKIERGHFCFCFPLFFLLIFLRHFLPRGHFFSIEFAFCFFVLLQ